MLHICNGSLNRCCRGRRFDTSVVRTRGAHPSSIPSRLSVPALARDKDVASYVSTYDLSTPLVMGIVPVGTPVVAQVTAIGSQVVPLMTNVTAVAAGIAMVAILNVMAQVATITFYIAPILSAVHAVVLNIPPILADVVTER